MMLEEKISNEFQRYFLSMMATSKDNIFAHSNEIETKKQIKKELYTFAETLDSEQKELLSVQNNLIESVYRFETDLPKRAEPVLYQDILKDWLKSIMV